MNPLERMQDITDKLSEGLVKKEDLVRVFKIFLSLLKDIKSNNEANLENGLKSMGNIVDKYYKEMSSSDRNLKEVTSKIKTEISNKISETSKMLYSEIEKVKDSIPNVADLSPLEAKIEASIRDLETKIPKLPEELKPEAIRDKLETIKEEKDKLAIKAIGYLDERLNKLEDRPVGGGRVGWGAHPVTVQGDGTIIDKNARIINFTGGTVTRNADGTITVPLGSSGSSSTILSTVETVDGSNTVFQFDSAPDIVYVDNVPLQKVASDGTVNWTGNAIITLTVAPNYDIFGLNNTRLTKRTESITSSANPTIDTDDVDMFLITAQAEDIVSFTTNLSGTPTQGQSLWITITGTAARGITWGNSFESSTVSLPSTTVSTNRLDIGFIWNTVTNKWRCIASG